MTYRLLYLAPGSYDVALNGVIIASLVRSDDKHPFWTVELLLDLRPEERPAPFTQAEHTFATFEAACIWLGNPAVLAR